MKKLMLSVAVFMMGVSTLGLYAQDSNVEPVKKDSVPTEEPKKDIKLLRFIITTL